MNDKHLLAYAILLNYTTCKIQQTKIEQKKKTITDFHEEL